jgi:hypothetical protein
MPIQPIRFVALCDACTWQGRERLDSLTAVRDYDRHILTSAHLNRELEALMAPDVGPDDDGTLTFGQPDPNDEPLFSGWQGGRS